MIHLGIQLITHYLESKLAPECLGRASRVLRMRSTSTLTSRVNDVKVDKETYQHNLQESDMQVV